jgi:hypothetical protein
MEHFTDPEVARNKLAFLFLTLRLMLIVGYESKSRH